MKLSALGEFNLINLIKDAVQSTRHTSSEASRRILIDIGDDTAAWAGSSNAQLATTDSLVEGVHFEFQWCSWEDLGHKSLAVNLSDIAAMGGRALFALVSLSCPPDVDSAAVLEYYRGMTTLAAEHGVVIAGGNITSAPVVMSTVAVIGEASPERLMTRSGALPGNVIAVTGVLGGAATALSLLSSGADTATLTARALTNALNRPRPRLSEALVLVNHGVRCAIDISDGLLSDLGHVCECSGMSAVVHAMRVPCHMASGILPEDRIRFALAGGEDYELLFCCEPSAIPHITADLQCPVTVIGEILARSETPEVSVLDGDGARVTVDRSGWRHF